MNELDRIALFEDMTTNSDTLHALCEAENPDAERKVFDSVEDLMTDLESEDGEVLSDEKIN